MSEDSTFKDIGIVLRECRVKESDKKLTVLFREHGKLNVYAKGAGNPKSRFFAGSSLFCLCDFVIYKGAGFFSLSQAELIENFYDLAGDFDKFRYASFFLELTDKLIYREMSARIPMLILFKALMSLARGGHEPGLTFAVFCFRLLANEGFTPESGRLGDMLGLDEADRSVLGYILESDLDAVFRFGTTSEITAHLRRAAELFARECTGAELKIQEAK